QDPVWRPDEFSTLYQRSVYQSMRSLSRRNFTLLRKTLPALPSPVREQAERVLQAEEGVLQQMGGIMGRKLSALKTRLHGDFHLGQVLFTGKDFVIIDFEGEPSRTLSERRLKRSPLRDVAGMLRSFHYAARVVLRNHLAEQTGDSEWLLPWMELWQVQMGGIFLRSYLERLGGSAVAPRDPRDLEAMLRAFLLEKAVYEIGYELNNRPDWLDIPLSGIEMLLGSSQNPESRIE
ncbi:MAG: phosphotransferase, partial [Desulfuromonadales bacterium]|nr:phosphotransferase [Desulfuromonadales bacterium]